MATEAQKGFIREYAQRVRDARRAHAGVSEPGLAPHFFRLLQDLLPTLMAPAQLTPVPEYRNPGVGRPDIALARQGQPARAFIELKASEKTTNGARWSDAHDKRQFKRFSEFAHWATCNFHEFRLYERGEDQGYAALLPKAALDPDQTDVKANRAIDRHDPTAALALLERLCQAQPPVAQDAEHLAELLAYSARLVRGIVQDRLAELTEQDVTGAPLQQVRQEFRDVLYSHPQAAGYPDRDFDELFSGAFAQTLAFGLLLVREATNQPVDRNAYQHMPDEHPLMRTALHVLSMPEVADDIGMGFDVMLDTVNCLQPLMLAPRAGGRDPILYFYENFLATFDPEARQRFGVYYTPVKVVRYMVGALDRALRENLDVDGLADESVHILDPAVGTGTFLLGIAERVRDHVTVTHGPGQVQAALRGLMARMYGFELLVGPYAVSHYRLHHAFSRVAGGEPVELPRLGVYLTDTLARPDSAAPLGVLGFVTAAIQDERRESNRIKTEQPILAIIGNPPYRRLKVGENESLVGPWLDNLWGDLKQPVRDAGKGGDLKTFPEMSVAFWRWSMWKLFEAPAAPRRGVVALITNRTFLTGWPYAGLRKMLKERFDRIEIIDLRGDVNQGARAGVQDDQGVFNIKVGTCITIAIADGTRVEGELAKVSYNDVWAHNLTSKNDKLNWLLRGAGVGRCDGDVEVVRGSLDDMRPRPFLNGELIALSDCFMFKSSGLESKRDDVVYGFSPIDLERRIRRVLTAPVEERDALFNSTSMNPAHQAQAEGFNAALVRQMAYRPLDIRMHYNSKAWNDRPRTDLSSTWGQSNVAIFAMPSGTLAGPGAWCHALYPDRHAFRGSYGGYAFPLYDRRPDKGPYNLKPELVQALSRRYGAPVTPEQVFDTILCMLSARSYTTRFAEDLEDVFPHVPFPASPDVFREAANIGAEIRAVETFGRPPNQRFAHVARAETAPIGPLASVERLEDGGFSLSADRSGRISNVPQEVWDFAVSGYRVLPRWINARAQEAVEIGPRFIPELQDVAQRIAELLFLFGEADRTLEATLADSLPRSVLGLAAGEEPQDEEPD